MQIPQVESPCFEGTLYIIYLKIGTMMYTAKQLQHPEVLIVVYLYITSVIPMKLMTKQIDILLHFTTSYKATILYPTTFVYLAMHYRRIAFMVRIYTFHSS